MRIARGTIYVALIGMSLGWAALVQAQGIPASEVIKNRIANFREIGTAFKGIGDELKAKEPYIPTIQENTQHIESLGSEVLSWFPPGTGPTPEPEKGIIDTILGWFSSDAESKEEEGKTMNEVAKAGDKTAIAAQFKALGGTCKTCHDTFREEEEKK